MRLIIRDLKKTYDEITIINKAGYAFESNKVYGIVGDRKSGKSTLLECIAGETAIDAGYIRLDIMASMKKCDYRDFGFVSNDNILPDYMTGQEYITHCLKVHNRQAEPEHIREIFSQAGIKDNMVGALIKAYSPEEKLKLKLLTIMIVEPPVILLDEPTNMRVINWFVERMNKGHIIIVTAETIEKLPDICHDILRLHNGVLEGVTKEN